MIGTKMNETNNAEDLQNDKNATNITSNGNSREWANVWKYFRRVKTRNSKGINKRTEWKCRNIYTYKVAKCEFSCAHKSFSLCVCFVAFLTCDGWASYQRQVSISFSDNLTMCLLLLPLFYAVVYTFYIVVSVATDVTQNWNELSVPVCLLKCCVKMAHELFAVEPDKFVRERVNFQFVFFSLLLGISFKIALCVRLNFFCNFSIGSFTWEIIEYVTSHDMMANQSAGKKNNVCTHLAVQKIFIVIKSNFFWIDLKLFIQKWLMNDILKIFYFTLLTDMK